MRKLKFVPFLLAGLMAVTPVFAATVTAPIDLETTVSETFDNMTDYREHSDETASYHKQINAKFGSVKANPGWYADGSLGIEGFDFVGLKEANEIDSTKAVGDKAIAYQDTTGYTNTNIGWVQYQDVDLSEGDIYAFSFDVAYETAKLHSISVKLNASNDDVATDALDENGNNIGTFSFGGGSKQSAIIEIPRWSSKYYCGGNETTATVPQAKKFQNVKLVIRTKDETSDNKQTIEYLVDNVSVKKETFYLSGSEKTIKHIGGIFVNSNPALWENNGVKYPDSSWTSAKINLWFDNVNYSVTKSTDDFVETFDTINKNGFYTSNYYNGKINNILVSQAYGIASSDIENGVFVHKVNAGNNIPMFINSDATLSKGDIYTISFEYGSQGSSQGGAVYVSLYGDGVWNNENGLKDTSIKFSTDAIGTATSGTNEAVMRYANQTAKFFDYKVNGETKWLNSTIKGNGELDRYDIVIDTEDEAMDGQQTVAYYLNGVLKGKSTLYPVKDGVVSSDIINRIAWVQIKASSVDNDSEPNTFKFDNIWISKTANALEATKINGKINVTYSYPPVYETGVKSSIIAAYFGADDALLGTKIVPLTTDETSRTLKADFEPVDGTIKTKLFIWNDVNDIVPVAPALEVR